MYEEIDLTSLLIPQTYFNATGKLYSKLVPSLSREAFISLALNLLSKYVSFMLSYTPM